jgi:ribosomal protein L11
VHGGRIGVIAVLNGGDESLAKDIAMHVAAANPQFVKPEQVPAAVVEKEKEIQIEIAVQNRQCTVKMLPTATPLLIEALKKTGRDRKKQKEWKYDGNISFDQVLKVAEQMREAKKSLAKEFSGTVKEVLGTCVSLGCTVEK